MIRRLLMITYGFPPVAGVATERTLRHVMYLPEHGWEPVVVAPANPGYRLVDPRSLERIPDGTEVHRAFSLEPAHLRAAVRASVTAGSGAWRALRSGLARSGTPLSPHEQRQEGVTGGLHERLNGVWARLIPLVFFPDDQLLWAPAAALVAISAAARHPAHAIYSSSPPISGHLAAALVHSRTGLPWIADFRDPWIGNAFSRQPAAPQTSLQLQLERFIVAGASRCVFATPALRDTYAARYPTLANRFVSITNGYDLSELESIPRRPPGTNTRFVRVIYAGAVYGEDELRTFLDGLELARARIPNLRDRLRVEFIGSFNPANETLAAARLPDLAPIVSRRSQVSRLEALSEIGKSDAGLLLLGDGPGRHVFVGTKLYDYLGLDRQVLAVAPPGDARQILEGLGWGVVAEPTPEGIAAGVARLLESPRPPRLIADPERRFERRRLSAQLAEVLDGLVDGTR